MKINRLLSGGARLLFRVTADVTAAALIFCVSLTACDFQRDRQVTEREYSEVPEPYRTIEEAESFLKEKAGSFPEITSLVSTGASAEGRQIYALIISGDPSRDMDLPAVLLTGSIHGNEYISGEILYRYADWLLDRYGAGDREITDLIDNNYIAFIPTMNPDGHCSGRRYNARGVDLNRNFPFYGADESERSSWQGSCAFSEPETRAVRDFTLAGNFDLGISFHSGEVVINLPFDYVQSSDAVPENNDLLWELGHVYGDAGLSSGSEYVFCKQPDIYDSVYADRGVVNGGDWYVIQGSMQDWSFLEAGCIEMTVEVSSSYSPDTEEGIERIFRYNRDSITAFIGKAAEVKALETAPGAGKVQ